ncbi:hypothetical protein LLG46_15550 [bacterium]|nr:hypothetical protein [bacterium]
MDSRPVNPIIAALYGAVVALAIGYGLCFFLLRAGVANVTSPGDVMDYGGPAFARAGLNLCAIQHASLKGSGTLGGAKVSADVVLPIITWAIIPIAALFVSGYAAGRLRAGSTGFGVIAPAVIGGILYALVLAALSSFFAASIKSGALPSAGGYEFDPPRFPLHPTFKSTLLAAGLFSVIFTYIGSHLSIHKVDRRHHVSRWWVCGKSIIPIMLVLQLLIAIAAQAWLISKTGPENPEGPAGRAIVKFQPTVAGIAYGLINGAMLRAAIVSGDRSPFAAEINLYKGLRLRTATTTSDENELAANKKAEEKVIPFGSIAYIGAGLMAIIGLISGALAVRWGSRDGSLPTALRIGIIHAAYLGITMFVCTLAWRSMVRAGSIKVSSGVFIKLQYEPTMLWSFFGVFITAFIGAYLTNRLYSSGRRGFPPV